MVSRISSSFFRRKLTIFALALYFSAIFLPWLVEDYVVVRVGFREWLRVTDTYWSFVAYHNNNWSYFQEFWFAGFPGLSPYGWGPSSLYLGWFLLFTVQIWVGVLCFSYRFKWIWLLRGWEATAVVASTFFTSVVGIFQFVVQHDIFYEDIGGYRVIPHFGFWVALASLMLLTISYWRSSEREQVKRFFSSLRRSWKLSLVLILILVSAFLLVNEFQFQTGVTKHMVVEIRGPAKPADPKLWEGYFKTIITIATLFRARVTYNSPEYLYCQLEVPVISYRLLMAVYNSIGFIAGEPTFMTLF